jgi:glycosyltransferase involved in cell wall biosynthesis
MLVLHIIASMDPRNGGVCQAVRSMIGGMKEFDVENEVASLDADSESFIASDSFVTHTLGPSRGPWAYSALLSPWLALNLARYDVVIIHGLWLFHGFAVRKALNALRHQLNSLPRCYVMPHGMLDPYFQLDPDRRIKALRNWLYWKLIEHKVVNQADNLLFTCEEERLLAREPFRPYHPPKESVVGLGVEEPPTQSEAMQQAFHQACPEVKGQPYLLFLSRIHPKKGVDLLIRAYAELARSFLSNLQSTINNPQSLFPSLVIAGPLDSAYAADMQALAEQLLPSSLKTENCKLVPSILFPGMLRGDSKWGAFYGCQAFVLPSHQENFGIAVVEALACGKPVLISNKVNIWREIDSEQAGLVAKDSEDGIKEMIEQFLTEKVTFRNPASCFQKYFTVLEAASKLVSALGGNPTQRNLES